VDPAGKFAYVANYQDATVSGYSINAATGALTSVLGSPFPTSGCGAGESLCFPTSVAVDPTGKFAYVSFGNISGYTINATTGALTPIPGSPFPAGGGPASQGIGQVAVDPTGRFAYVANESDKGVWGYTINATTGALTAIPGSPFPGGILPFSAATTPVQSKIFSFAPQEVGKTGSFEPISLGNTGSGQLTISNVQLDPTYGTGDFKVNGSNCTGARLAPAGTCTLLASFKPKFH
jgi:DNA-binding beta-propeller fold protein YncE